MTPRDDGSWLYEPPKVRVRFLLTDGATVDVVCERDDSDMRGALLDVLNPGHAKEDYAVSIAGSVRIDPPPAVTPAKARPRKRAAPRAG